MRFIRTLDGALVNLAHVHAIGRETKHGTASLIGAEGRIGEMLWSHAEQLEGQLVPAAAGQFVTTITVTDPEDYDGSPMDRFIVSRYPVAAWRVWSGSAEPVLPQETAMGEVVLIELPDGRLLEPDMGEYDSLEAAKRALLARTEASRAAAQEAADKARQAATSKDG